MKQFTITADANGIDIILAGLGKLPLETSMNIYAQIRKQCDEQAKTGEKNETTN